MKCLVANCLWAPQSLGLYAFHNTFNFSQFLFKWKHQPDSLLTLSCGTSGLLSPTYSVQMDGSESWLVLHQGDTNASGMQQERKRYLGGKISLSSTLSTPFAVTEAVNLNFPPSQGQTGLGSSTWHLATQGMAGMSTCAAFGGTVSAGGSQDFHGHRQLHPWLQELGFLELGGGISGDSG